VNGGRQSTSVAHAAVKLGGVVSGLRPQAENATPKATKAIPLSEPIKRMSRQRKSSPSPRRHQDDEIVIARQAGDRSTG
jgi:hypothetical protein